MKEANCTIVLPVKNRKNLAIGWLKLALDIGYCFDVIIADGSYEFDEESKYLKNLCKGSDRLFYNYFGYDQTPSHYYKKMAAASKKIATNYVVMCDCDDFYDQSGLKKCIEFLTSHPDYSACMGNVLALEEAPSIKLSALKKAYVGRAYKEDTAFDRISSYFKGGAGVYYSVTRAEIFSKIWKNIYDLNFQNLRTTELYYELAVLIMGRFQVLDSPFYVRRHGQNVGNEAGLSDNLLLEFLDPMWSKDINAAIESLCTDYSDFAIDPYLIKSQLVEWWVPYFITTMQISADPKVKLRVHRKMIKKFLSTGGLLSIIESFSYFDHRKNKARNYSYDKRIIKFFQK